MATKRRTWRPYEVFFAEGKTGRGIVVLCMQLSLVLWPAAIRMARQFEEAREVQRLLNDFSQSHHVTVSNQINAGKRFRPAPQLKR